MGLCRTNEDKRKAVDGMLAEVPDGRTTASPSMLAWTIVAAGRQSDLANSRDAPAAREVEQGCKTYTLSMRRASSALAEARTIQQTKKVLDVAAAAEIYAKRQKPGDEAEAIAAEIKVEALRKLGDMLQATPRAKSRFDEGAGREPSSNDAPTGRAGPDQEGERRRAGAGGAARGGVRQGPRRPCVGHEGDHRGERTEGSANAKPKKPAKEPAPAELDRLAE